MKPTLLVDIGSTLIKTCEYRPEGGLGAVATVGRRPDLSPGEQVRALIDDRRPDPDRLGLRICSSASGGVRVGVLGRSRRQSVAAATRAVESAGGNVVYEWLLGNGPPGVEPVPAVDVLVLVGGVDGADPRYLRQVLAEFEPADFPHDVLVWAGQNDPDLVAGLPVGHVVANVLDEELRPALHGLSDLIRNIYVGDLVDRKGLRPLAGLSDTPILPTPATVAAAARRLATEPLVPLVPAPAPFVIVDVGGATTDVVYCAELRPEGADRISPGEPIVRHVFTDLGVAGSLPGLRHRLSADPSLSELATAIAPDRPRALYQDICDGVEDALSPSAAFGICLFLALRRLTDPAGLHLLEPGHVAGFVVTGGAWTGTPEPVIRRVIAAGCRTPDARWSMHVDRAYELWAHGLLTVSACSSR